MGAWVVSGCSFEPPHPIVGTTYLSKVILDGWMGGPSVLDEGSIGVDQYAVGHLAPAGMRQKISSITY